MRIFLVFLLSISSFSLFSQIVFEKTKHDFGDLNLTSTRYVDIVVTNKGPKKEYLLSVKKPAEIVYLVNGQFMDKDSSLVVRLQINRRTTGRFSYEVQIYTSDKNEPTIIKLTGNITETSSDQSNSFLACPDFNSTPQSRKTATDFELTVITVDKNTRKLLEMSSVTILQNGQPLGIFKTDKKGEVKRRIPLGFTYFYGTHEGYYPTELGSYVNAQRNVVILELTQKPIVTTPKPDPKPDVIAVTPPVEKEPTIIEIEEKLEDQLAQEIVTSSPVKDTVTPKKLSDLDKNNFDETNFKPINVTFVLDISASMNQGEKMELMKYSLYQLTDMLRKQDKISIVTYASETKLLLPATSGVEKEKIKALVGELRAGGLTSGGAGIKMGYKQALKSYIADGTNQVIVITDGGFNKNSKDYKKAIKKYKKQGINLSVVGILNNGMDKRSMEEISLLGGGRYIPIFKLADAMNNLKQEIRLISFRQ